MALSEEYRNLVTEFTRATNGGKLEWKKQNPATIFIEISLGDVRALVSIQKVVGRGPAKLEMDATGRRVVKRAVVDSFLFIMKKPVTNEIIVQVDSQADPTLQQPLGELFEAAVLSTERKNVELIKRIISNLEEISGEEEKTE